MSEEMDNMKKEQEELAETVKTTETVDSLQEAKPAGGAKKTAKKKGGKIAIALAAIAVVAVVIVFFAPQIANAAAKMFKSPAGYFQYVVEKSCNESIEKITESYDKALSGVFAVEEKSTDAEVGVEVGKDLREILEDISDVEFDWLEKVSIKLNSALKSDANKTEVGVLLNDEQLISFRAMSDTEDGKAYFQVPEMTKTYLGVELGDFYEMADIDTDDLDEVKAVLDELYKVMPEKKTLENILKRYSSMAISCIEDVEESKEKVTAGELKTSYTVLDAVIDEKALQEMLEVIVPELKEDKEIEKIIREMLSVQEEVDADDVYDEFLDELDDWEDIIDELDDIEFELELRLYVNKKGEICGFDIAFDEMDAKLSSMMIQKGGKFAYELEGKVDKFKFSIDGEGTIGTKLAGDFTVKAAGMKLAEISLTDVKVKELSKGYFNGTLQLTVPKAIAELIEEEFDELPFSVEDLVFEIKSDCAEDKSDLKVSVYDKKKLLCSAFVIIENSKKAEIKFPKDKDVVMIEDEDDLLEWADEIDIDEFLEDLGDKLDEDLYELLEDYIYDDFSLSDFGFGGKAEAIPTFPGTAENWYDEDENWYDEDEYWYDEDEYWYDEDEYWYDEDEYWYDEDDYDYDPWGDGWY